MAEEKRQECMTDQQLSSELAGRKSAGAAGKLMIGIGTVLVVVGMFAGWNIPLVIAGVVIAIAGEKIREKQQKKIQQQLGDHVVTDLINDMFQDVVYDPTKRLSSEIVYGAKLSLPEHQGLKGSHDVKAVYQEKPIEFSGITLIREHEYYEEETNIARTSEEVVFQGKWMVCNYGGTFPAEVQITPRTKMQKLRKNGIKTGNEEFDKRFFVQADDEHEAVRCILTPDRVGAILRAAEKSSGNVYMSVLREGWIHLLVQGSEFFDLGKGSTNVELLRERWTNEIHWFTDLIDALRMEDILY